MSEIDGLKEAVREAVREELKAANIVDGPTHVQHHEFIGNLCDSFDTAKKTAIRCLVNTVVLGTIAAVIYFWKR